MEFGRRFSGRLQRHATKARRSVKLPGGSENYCRPGFDGAILTFPGIRGNPWTRSRARSCRGRRIWPEPQVFLRRFARLAKGSASGLPRPVKIQTTALVLGLPAAFAAGWYLRPSESG